MSDHDRSPEADDSHGGDSERFGPLQRSALLIVREYMGEDLIPFLRRGLEMDPGEEWKWPELEEERVELLEALDRLERRMALELELHTDSDGMVDSRAFIDSMLRWAREEEGD